MHQIELNHQPGLWSWHTHCKETLSHTAAALIKEKGNRKFILGANCNWYEQLSSKCYMWANGIVEVKVAKTTWEIKYKCKNYPEASCGVFNEIWQSNISSLESAGELTCPAAEAWFVLRIAFTSAWQT